MCSIRLFLASWIYSQMGLYMEKRVDQRITKSQGENSGLYLIMKVQKHLSKVHFILINSIQPGFKKVGIPDSNRSAFVTTAQDKHAVIQLNEPSDLMELKRNHIQLKSIDALCVLIGFALTSSLFGSPSLTLYTPQSLYQICGISPGCPLISSKFPKAFAQIFKVKVVLMTSYLSKRNYSFYTLKSNSWALI